MTTEVTQVNEENVFEAPQAELSEQSSDKPIANFERFSAWWVFLLSIVTAGIYPLWWFYSRGQTMSANAKDYKLNMLWIYLTIVLFLFITVLDIIQAENTAVVLISGVVAIVYLVAYIVAVFSLRRALRDIINQGDKDSYEPIGFLSGLLTFFFAPIYLQYKINQAIDFQI